jgi:hypothetical protein
MRQCKRCKAVQIATVAPEAQKQCIPTLTVPLSLAGGRRALREPFSDGKSLHAMKHCLCLHEPWCPVVLALQPMAVRQRLDVEHGEARHGDDDGEDVDNNEDNVDGAIGPLDNGEDDGEDEESIACSDGEQ